MASGPFEAVKSNPDGSTDICSESFTGRRHEIELAARAGRQIHPDAANVLAERERYLSSGIVKGFGCRPMTDGPRTPRLGAGVRKPPRNETAGSGTRSCRGRYGDLSAAEEARDGNRRH